MRVLHRFPDRNEAVLLMGSHLHRYDLSTPCARLLHQVFFPLSRDIGAVTATAVLLAYSENNRRLDADCYLEVRDCESLLVTDRKRLVVDRIWLQDMAVSPDGRWLAIASYGEALAILARPHNRQIALIQGGEHITGCTFSPDSNLLIAGHTFQGGGYISLYDLSQGRLRVLHRELSREMPSPCQDFADTIISAQFTADSRRVVIYESSWMRGEPAPDGWRGNLMLVDVASGAPLWWRMIDGDVTGDTRSLADLGMSMGYHASLCIIPERDEVVVESANGLLLCFSLATGDLNRRIQLPDIDLFQDILLDSLTGWLWVLANNQLTCCVLTA